MDQLNKLPRWFLILLAAGFFGLTGIVGNTLYAEGENTKKIAYAAKNATEELKLIVAGISGQIQDIKNAEQKDHDETRQDLNEIRQLLLKAR
jgi:hypothetical protein